MSQILFPVCYLFWILFGFTFCAVRLIHGFLWFLGLVPCIERDPLAAQRLKVEDSVSDHRPLPTSCREDPSIPKV